MNNSSAQPERQPTAPANLAEPIVGQSSAQAATPTTAIPARASRRAASSVMEQTLQSRFLVLATLFGVTGALGLPLLWMSPAFSRIHKAIWSVMVLAYTSALIGGTWAIVVWAYRQFQ